MEKRRHIAIFDVLIIVLLIVALAGCRKSKHQSQQAATSKPAAFSRESPAFPGRTIASQLAYMVVFQESDGAYWDMAGATPGRVEVPACFAWGVVPLALTASTAAEYAADVNHIGLGYVALHPNTSQMAFRSFVPGLENLAMLSLAYCIDISDLSPLANLTKLRHLELNDCPNIANLSPLVKLTSLTELDLSFCDGISDLSPLAKLTNLRKLALPPTVTTSQLKTICRNHTKLTWLSLWRCSKIFDLSPLAKLTNLTELELISCDNISNLSPLTKLTTLTDLELIGCDRISDLSPLAKVTTLTELRLTRNNNISDRILTTTFPTFLR
jgi:hypothetical protein